MDSDTGMALKRPHENNQSMRRGNALGENTDDQGKEVKKPLSGDRMYPTKDCVWSIISKKTKLLRKIIVHAPNSFLL